MPWIVLVLAIYAVASLATVFLYWRDKRAAQRSSRRIPERTLHFFELCGGWPGALIARRVFHHKTRKPSYRLTFGLIVVIHVAAWAAIGWFILQRPPG